MIVLNELPLKYSIEIVIDTITLLPTRARSLLASILLLLFLIFLILF